MGRLVLIVGVLLGLLALSVCAQEPPDADPTVFVDAGNLATVPHRVLNFPKGPWADAQRCMEENGMPHVNELDELPLPTLLVVPRARLLVVKDPWLTQQTGTIIGYPTVAHALVGSYSVVVTTSASQSWRVLRHEALHFFLYWFRTRMDHGENDDPSLPGTVKAIFTVCDRDRPIP